LEFLTARKTIKGRTFSNLFYFISNLLSISPAQLRRCGIHRNRSILDIAENKIIIFRKRTFFSIKFIYLFFLFPYLAKLIFYSFDQTA